METTESRAFYSPLDASTSQIRLFHLQPRRAEDPDKIAGELSVVALDEGPEYEALSYEWGNPSEQVFSVTITGTPHSVRENLWWALYYLRDEHRTRTLWIDALCIDQENTQERNHQVMQMGKVYETASRVVVWLGHGDFPDEELRQRYGDTMAELYCSRNMERVLEYIDLLKKVGTLPLAANSRLSKCLEREFKSKKNPLDIDGSNRSRRTATTRYESEFNTGITFDPRDKEFIPARYVTSQRPWQDFFLSSVAAIRNVCCLSYWDRLWIVQEIALAKEAILQWEHVSISWIKWAILYQEMLKLSEIFPWQSGKDLQLCRTFCNDILHSPFDVIVDRRSQTYTEKHLYNLVIQHRKPKCQDIKDKVYGLRALSLVCCRTAIPVNYTISVTELRDRLLQHHYTSHERKCNEPEREFDSGLIWKPSLGSVLTP